MDYLGPRFDFLRSSQNQDGGWGYFPGKQSWLEPTVYATLALARDPASSEPVERAWRLVRSWQNPDGGWRPSAAVAASTWVTSLAVTLADTLAYHGPETDRGAAWLRAATGAESTLLKRFCRAIGLFGVEHDIQYPGWPWRTGTTAWVEPTVHALVALKKISHRQPHRALAARIADGEHMLLAVRCADGGWNCGVPRVQGVDLPSYAESTALALLGLGDKAPPGARDRARAFAALDVAPLARAWLRLCRAGDCPSAAPEPVNDILLTALESIDPSLLSPGARA